MGTGRSTQKSHFTDLWETNTSAQGARGVLRSPRAALAQTQPLQMALPAVHASLMPRTPPICPHAVW